MTTDTAVRQTQSATKRWLILGGVLGAVTALWYWQYFTRSELGVMDWTKETFYFGALRDSLRHGHPPLRIARTEEVMRWPAIAATDSYLANPETMFLSPFLPLAVLPVEWFFRLYMAGSLVVAVIGSVSLTKALRWTPAAGGVLYALVFLNPWLVQHVVIGYTPWVTVTWLPLVAALVVRGRPVWAGVVWSLVVWAGGMHVFVWAMMAAVVVVAVLVVRRLPWWTLATATGCAVGFAAPRLVLIVAASGELADRVPSSSYSSVADLWGVLTDTASDPYAIPAAYDTFGVNLYDGLFYTGWWFWVVSAGAAVWLGRRSWPYVLAAVGFAVLGYGTVWKSLGGVFPFLGVQVYPWRFLCIGYVFAAIIVALGAERAVRRGEGWLLLVLVPVMWGFYWRTQFFAAA